MGSDNYYSRYFHLYVVSNLSFGTRSEKRIINTLDVIATFFLVLANLIVLIH